MTDAAETIPCSSTPSEPATLTVIPLPVLNTNTNLWRHTEIYNLFKQVHFLGYDFSSIAIKMRQTEDAGFHSKNFYSTASCEAQFRAVIEATKNDPYHVKFFEQLGTYSERVHADRIYKQYDQYCKTLRKLVKRLVVNNKLKNLLLAFENGDIGIEHYPKIENIIDECSKVIELAATFEEHENLTKFQNIFEKLIPSGDEKKFKTVTEMRTCLSKAYQDYFIRQDVGDLTLGHIGDLLGSSVKTMEEEPESSSKVVTDETPMEVDKDDVLVTTTEKEKKPSVEKSAPSTDSKKLTSLPSEANLKKSPPKTEVPDFKRKSTVPKTITIKDTDPFSIGCSDSPPSTVLDKVIVQKPELSSEPVFKKPRLPVKAIPPSYKKPKETVIHVNTPRPLMDLKSQLALKIIAKTVPKVKIHKSRNGKLICDTDVQTHLVGVDANPKKIKVVSKKPAPPTRFVPGAIKRHFATQTGPMEISDAYPIRWIDNFFPSQSITTAVVKTCYRSYSRYNRAKTITIMTSMHRAVVDPNLCKFVHPISDVVRLVLESMVRRDYRNFLRHPVRYEVNKYCRRIKCPMDTITIEDLMVAGKVVTLDQMELHAALIYANAVVYGALTHYSQLQNYATCLAFQKIRLAERHNKKS